MQTEVLALRLPKDMLEDVDRAVKISGCTSTSEFVRDAIRRYLERLSLLSQRAERVKGERA